MKLLERIAKDYFMRSKLETYREMLILAKNNGYKMMSVIDFYKFLLKEENKEHKILVNRHDIDTSSRVARKMFQIEKEIFGDSGNSSVSYYFRWTTLDKKLIREIEYCGFEASYHYEEIASYAKKKHIKSVQQIEKELSDIRAIFVKNLKKFRNETGCQCDSVCSHGDFVNRKLSLANQEILKNYKVRKYAEILVEAYDEELLSKVVYLSDVSLSNTKIFTELKERIKDNTQYIMMLTHPRNWEKDVTENTKENIRRLWQGICYRIL